jgi:hypothetical protein
VFLQKLFEESSSCYTKYLLGNVRCRKFFLNEDYYLETIKRKLEKICFEIRMLPRRMYSNIEMEMQISSDLWKTYFLNRDSISELVAFSREEIKNLQEKWKKQQQQLKQEQQEQKRQKKQKKELLEREKQLQKPIEQGRQKQRIKKTKMIKRKGKRRNYEDSSSIKLEKNKFVVSNEEKNKEKRDLLNQLEVENEFHKRCVLKKINKSFYYVKTLTNRLLFFPSLEKKEKQCNFLEFNFNVLSSRTDLPIDDFHIVARHRKIRPVVMKRGYSLHFDDLIVFFPKDECYKLEQINKTDLEFIKNILMSRSSENEKKLLQKMQFCLSLKNFYMRKNQCAYILPAILGARNNCNEWHIYEEQKLNDIYNKEKYEDYGIRNGAIVYVFYYSYNKKIWNLIHCTFHEKTTSAQFHNDLIFEDRVSYDDNQYFQKSFAT